MTASLRSSSPDHDLLAQFEVLQSRLAAPMHARDAAEALGVSEGALTEARRASPAAVALRGPDAASGYARLFARLAGLGAAMGLTRNAHCVIEITDAYAEPREAEGVAVLDGALGMRIDWRRWRAAYAMAERTPHGDHRSIQFFDASGDAVHKVYCAQETDAAGFEALIADWSDPDAPPRTFDAPSPAPADPENGETLRTLGRGAARALLEGAAQAGLPIRLEVGSSGCLQRFRGRVETIKTTGAWLNVLDPHVNLHMRWDRIAAARLARAEDGTERVEFRDAGGALFCVMADAATEAGPSAAGWRTLADALPGV
ncbi:MAG: ChuX/HutX family heme-like substrate-binding protein [Rubrimonas sp.]|uniref:ChuX/HutX family heme-like substrate-binding protein n=1 Tax=Rubrimonas sp. TaxID=2036015 RepID=UPI002FDE7462